MTIKEQMIRSFVKTYAKKGNLKDFFVFGYGSLMYPNGVNGRGMQHHYTWKDLILARLKGYKRGMFAGYGRVSFYGILPHEEKDYLINGALIQIHTGFDLACFLLSEGTAPVQERLFGRTMYKLVDVTDKIRPYEAIDHFIPKNASIHTLVCEQDYGGGRGRRPYPGYQERVWLGIRLWGRDFVDEFLKTGGVNPLGRQGRLNAFRRERTA